MSDAARVLADRLAIQDLAAHYARAVDRRDYDAFARIFTRDGRVAVYYGDPAFVAPTNEMRGIDKIMKGMRGIEQYRRTTHFVGNQTVELEANRAMAETYCLAHHLHEVEGRWSNFIMSIRYADRCVREPEGWRFAERVLTVDWTEERPVTPHT
jgi:3-phenylpropionate/cinnamic acid dioxygenase small subunit